MNKVVSDDLCCSMFFLNVQLKNIFSHYHNAHFQLIEIIFLYNK